MEEKNAKLALKRPPDKKWQLGGQGKVNVQLVWNDSFAERFSAIFMRGQTVLDELVISSLEPYMPLDTGNMIDSMRTSSIAGTGKIVVNTAYAGNVYYGRAIQGKNGALRGPYYFERMVADKKEYLQQSLAEEMGGKI